MDNESLNANIQELLDAGDEAKLRTFVSEHIQEFPEDIRDQIVMFLFEEAVTGYAQEADAEAAYVAEATETLEQLGTLRTRLKEYLQRAEVRGRLNLPIE